MAVWMVMLYHAGTPGFGDGWLGVDVFFVLSGFLITTLLLDEHHRSGGISLSAFWRRRILRLVPAYGVYAAVVTGLVFMTGPRTWLDATGWNIGAYLAALWTYWINYLPLGGVWEHQFLTNHLWSLALEQQFYLVLPLVLLLGLAIGRPTLILGAAIILCLILTFWGGVPGNPAFTLQSRGLSIFTGCFVAALAHGGRAGPRPAGLHHAATTVLILSVVGMPLARGDVPLTWVFSIALWTSTALVVAGHWHGWSAGADARVLSLRPLAWSGQISYGLYLWHLAAWWLAFGSGVLPSGGALFFGVKLLLYFAFTYLLAWASWVWVETPALRRARAYARS